MTAYIMIRVKEQPTRVTHFNYFWVMSKLFRSLNSLPPGFYNLLNQASICFWVVFFSLFLRSLVSDICTKWKPKDDATAFLIGLVMFCRWVIHLRNPVCLSTPPSVPSPQFFFLNMSDLAVGNPAPICFE